MNGEKSLDIVASLTRSFRNTGSVSLKSEHLVFRTPPATAGTRFIFVVDASGSHAAQQRMRAVKGAIAALLESSCVWQLLLVHFGVLFWPTLSH